MPRCTVLQPIYRIYSTHHMHARIHQNIMHVELIVTCNVSFRLVHFPKHVTISGDAYNVMCVCVVESQDVYAITNWFYGISIRHTRSTYVHNYEKKPKVCSIAT